MFPDLLSLGPLHVKAYGLALAVSFVAGVWLAVKRAKKFEIKSSLVIDLSFFVLLSAIIGSRLFYVVYHVDEFRGHWLDAVNPFQSSGEVGIAGLSMMGGVVLAIITTMIFFIIKKTNPWPVLDSMAPSFLLGMAITRIGCFFNGCCFGLPTHTSCGVVFPGDSMAGWIFPDTPLWPVQIFATIAGLIMFGIIVLLEKKKSFHGYTFWLTLILYNCWRFGIDFIRYYEDSMIFVSINDVGFTRNQFISLCLVIISLIWFLYAKRNFKRNIAQPV